MITNKEIESISLSATKKDFYQIWNELLDTAKKLSERWDPTSTNESDPGIVLLKVLSAIADKLNYTIDKNTLEAFMPSAAQEESMRKLCDMLGYNMKYYQSATTDVKITYTGDSEKPIEIPAFSNIKNANDDVNYFTLQSQKFDTTMTTRTVECMEGEVVYCGDDSDGIIGLAQLDDEMRYYLPESQIAENGMFITNVLDGAEIADRWSKVDNLNTQKVGAKCFKFGFDSKLQMPFVQFPADVGSVMGDGLIIRYTRTNGANGNVSYGTLSKLEEPASWSAGDSTVDATADDFAIKNPSAAMNGANKESLTDAYNNYKKTIGTFDTLVTCRDYMNKIYQMTTDDANMTPLVSNIIVSDIRDDLNRAINLCTFSEYGIKYVDMSVKEANGADKISHFDLVLYPFATITGSVTKSNYDNSFKVSMSNKTEIEYNLKDYKTLSHVFKYPNETETVCIKNYLRLKAKITTTTKVNSVEEKQILNNIYAAIYDDFNMRKVDFGEEIPFDSILKTIQDADSRIKNVALEEPVLATAFEDAKGNTYEIGHASYIAKYNELTLRNVLAGRVPLFEYNEDFKPDFTEKGYAGYSPVYPTTTAEISKITSDFNVFIQDTEVKLNQNEVIQFRAPNYKTTLTYPCYVNYFLYAGDGQSLTIEKDVDFQLKSGQWLAINYTPSVTADDGTTSQGTPVNIIYDGNDTDKKYIIRPNFTMYDSNTWKDKGHNPSKTTGFEFGQQYQQKIEEKVKGLYAFDVNEQLEMRDKVVVMLNDGITYLYWERNDEDDLVDDNGKIKFKWDEDNGTAYTLKEGEYVYYTDASKMDLAYYGNGTKVIRHNASFDLYKDKTDPDDLAAKIADEGLLAGLPWRQYDLSGAGNANAIELDEYQYVNLVEGDTLKLLTTEESATHKVNIDLTKEWKTIKDAEYVLADGDNSTLLQRFSIPGVTWKARSILNINTSPLEEQTLHTTGTQSVMKTQDKITLTFKTEPETTQPLEPLWDSTAAEYKPLSLKTSFICQSSAGYITTTGDFDVELKVKAFEKTEVKDISESHSKVDFDNYGNGNWTKFSFDNSDGFDMNIMVNDGDHALMMFYYINTTEAVGKEAYIKLNPTTVTPKICNSENGGTLFANGWWVNRVGTANDYHLRPGVNVVEIPTSCTMQVRIGNDTKSAESIMIFSSFDAVKFSATDSSLVINKRLNYNYGNTIAGKTPSQQALIDIVKKDPDFDFYYNAIIDSSIAIDLNTNITDEEDPNYETMATPSVWYDYNNVNNKFVISEIDSRYLATGITLTSSSRK